MSTDLQFPYATEPPPIADPSWQGWHASWQQSEAYRLFWSRRLNTYLFPQKHDRWLDLGCGDGALSKRIQRQTGMGLTLADPCVTSDDIQKLSAISFLETAGPMSYDKILCKQCLHFEKDHWNEVFDGIDRASSPGGRCLVVALPGYTTIPLFRKAEAAIREAEPYWKTYQRSLEARGFSTLCSLERFPVTMPKQGLLDLVAARFLSDLSRLSEETLRNGIEEMDSALPDVVDFDDTVMCVTGVKLLDNMPQTYLEKSSLHGIGIFAGADAPPHQLLGAIAGSVVHYKSLPQDSYTEWMGVGNDAVFLSAKRSKMSMINHSDSPNVRFESGRLISRRPIAKGDELTMDYRIGLPSGYAAGYL